MFKFFGQFSAKVVNSSSKHRKKLVRKNELFVFLYPVSSCYRVFKYFDFWGQESEKNKEQSNKTKNCNRNFRWFTNQISHAKTSCFVDISKCSTDKENSNIEPIGRFSYSTVIRVKDYRYQYDSQKYSTHFYTPKILSLSKEKTLYNSEDKHRKKEKFHMLPGWFVYALKRCYPYSLTKPFIYKVQKCSTNCSRKESYYLPSFYRLFHNSTQ